MIKPLLLRLCALLPGTATPSDSDEEPREILVCLVPEPLEAEVIRPGGGVLHSSRAKLHRSLISVRGEFIPQLVALSDDM